MKFKVEIAESLYRVVEVEAKSDIEASEMVDKQYRNSEIVLGGDDFTDYTVKVL